MEIPQKPHSVLSTPAFRRHPVTVNNKEKNDALLHMWVPQAFGVAFQLPTFGHGLRHWLYSVFMWCRDRRLHLTKALAR